LHQSPAVRIVRLQRGESCDQVAQCLPRPVPQELREKCDVPKDALAQEGAVGEYRLEKPAGQRVVGKRASEVYLRKIFELCDLFVPML
jgi:hypothetical protein